jgi:hypothetical protein
MDPLFAFSQDEEYLILYYENYPVKDLLIISIRSLSEFFSGKEFKVEALLYL